MTAPLLEIRALSGGYQPIQIFQNVSFTLHHSETLGFFGPNGHGKTTLMKTMSGVLEPWTGDVIIEGNRINREAVRGSRRWRNFNYDVLTRRRMDPREVVQAGLIHVAQGNLLFPEMTVNEVLSIAPMAAGARANMPGAPTLARVFQLFPRLNERIGHKIRFLSGGERQMVSLAVGLLAAPKVLVLDEPTLGLSPKLRAELC
ncbi:MAG: ATP-binding cassette domain-containing protein, partial [Albidovulum sp.]|uniref:ATP-binding cassette domain-containing protein n=1 Tax=Albidovulum sp. TaxID=1872424 RepID=UPI003C81827D